MHIKEGFLKIISSKSKTFLAFCFCFIVGAAVSSLLDSNQLLFPLFISIFFILGALVFLWSNRLHRFLTLSLFFFIFGYLRFLITFPIIDQQNIAYYSGSTVDFVGVIAEEPIVQERGVTYVVGVTELKSADKNISGRVLLKAPLYPEFFYDDKVNVRCKLQLPEKNTTDQSTFRYDKYLAAKDIWSTCSFPRITKISNQTNFSIMKFLLTSKKTLENVIENLWPEPKSSFMAGLLYGNRSDLPQELKDNLSRTGVTHIIAISGFNITIIATILLSIAIYVGLRRRQAFWVVSFCIIIFVLFTGATASVVRAGIMGIIVLLARYLGRSSQIAPVLVATATLMVLVNPYVIMWDAGFQLSFLSTLGLIYGAPIIQKYSLVKIPGKIGELIVENFYTTIAAIIFTLPLILFQFGTLSIVAPLVNVLILWVIPWLMLGGFVALATGTFLLPLGRFIAGGIGVGMDYVLGVVSWFGSLSWSAASLRIPIYVMILSYGLLIYIVWRNKKNIEN